jgi:hypothetical protein
VRRVDDLLTWKSDGRAEGLAEGMAMGMLEARREDLLKVARVRFGTVPHDVTYAIRGAADIDQLGRWLDAALVAATVEQFTAMTRDA